MKQGAGPKKSASFLPIKYDLASKLFVVTFSVSFLFLLCQPKVYNGPNGSHVATRPFVYIVEGCS
jgi:hypothetical protein